MKKSLYLKLTIVILSVTFLSCSSQKKDTKINQKLLVGSWIDLSPAKLHFSMFENGLAQSDNMKTLLYKNWKVEGKNIIFTIESIGNGSSSIDQETFTIQKLTKDSLILNRKGYEFKYTRF